MPKKKLFAPPEPHTERDAKTCIAAGYAWFFINRKGLYLLKKAPAYVGAIGTIIASFSYFSADKSDVVLPNDHGANISISSVAYAGEQKQAIDTNLVIRRISGTNTFLVNHKRFLDEPSVRLEVEAMAKVDEYYAGKLGAKK